MAGGREWSSGPLPSRGLRSPLRVGGLPQASTASLQSQDSMKAGCFLLVFGVSQNDPNVPRE